jgi:hypothetical protein
MNSIALSADQFGIVYNVLSFGLVSMLACTIYTLVAQSRVLPKYRTALVMSSMVHTTIGEFSIHLMIHTLMVQYKLELAKEHSTRDIATLTGF